MKHFIAAALMALPISAQAEDIKSIPAPNGRIVVLSQAPCALPVPPDAAARARHASLISGGGEMLFTGCWIHESPVVYILWSDGDTSNVPETVFRGLKSI